MILMMRTNFVGELNSTMDGKEVTLAGWVHEVRELGKLTFLLLRDSTGIAQVIAKRGETDEALIKRMSLPKESVIVVRGTVRASKEARAGFEIVPNSIENVNPLSAGIPFEVTGKVPAELDVRLNNRHIDLRRIPTASVFRIESTILSAFRDTFIGKGFTEIRTPSIVAEATEGGTDLFPVQYFESKAYLAQSPQLYKQLAIIGGLDHVFIVTPVFRAEKSNDVYHLNESTQMDIEVSFADHNDVIALLGETAVNMVKSVIAKNKKELDNLGVKLQVPKPITITYTDAVDRLSSSGHTIKPGEDFTREHERAIGELFGEAVIVKEYPTALRAFYSRPNDDNPELSNSFDLIYKGMEVCSGAQRIHTPEMLIAAIKRKGLDPKGFEFYINAFRCGAPPHAGWSIGLERMAMQITGSQNIREASMFPRDRKRLTP